ncbi:MAG TPA: DISARM system helicase DrmA, partial [Candidatus Eremiobacteraeota bacterium]|nr:DISARM system helicase DrmA [Candidatus Eremiobacteraeota bacterium]
GIIDPISIREEQPDVKLQGKIRWYDQDGNWLITLFLVNDQKETKTLKDETWLFQTELIVKDPENKPIFQIRPHRREGGQRNTKDYEEENTLNMIYRKHIEFAAGHGVGVHTDVFPEDPERAVKISTKAIPAYEVPKTIPPHASEFPGLILDMKKLSDEKNPAELIEPLAEAYDKWIKKQNNRINNPAENLKEYKNTAQIVLEDCRESLKRIREGLDLLQNDNSAMKAFRFMNRAMAEQRIHTIYSEKVRRGEKPDINTIDVAGNRTWYPFQLAFILINIPSLTNLHHKDRKKNSKSIADLLWFPTGGGKTEAYLGLSAYTMAIRRLQGEIEGRRGEYGLAVLMRYTLRLLTLQQFQRASALICAMEVIRREETDIWGDYPFRLGLWVGYKTTPNKTEDSAESIKSAHGQFKKSTVAGSGCGSPAQLTNCPWCGEKIRAGQNIIVEAYNRGRGRTLIYCGDPLGKCSFSKKNSPDEGIPVLVVDEEIYRNIPSMLISTVDKFAQMPWKGEVQSLFGHVDGYCPRHGFRTPDLEDSDSHPPIKNSNFGAVKTVPHPLLRPPDLIIQDELHLISGPLGTLVGLYETALDYLCSWEVKGKIVRPKVIASTATIRKAGDQVHALFLHNVKIFPPGGLDVEDNFFSRQILPDDKNSGRKYLGICAPGRRMKEILVKVYVATMAATQQVFNKYGSSADPWMTLVGYFNSLRELGGMRRLVDDQVRTYLAKMEQRGYSPRYIYSSTIEELTSRKGATEIPELLDRMETPFKPEDRGEKRYPLDVLLATNMISVGVDVRRLSLMVLCGQPKYTAEYIQATSRVGRHSPGLVLTVYNWARPRDLSHYEHFEHYHGTFYKHVEALSVTPFAPRALDKGLTALLVALVRLMGVEFNANHKAGNIHGGHKYITKAIELISERAELVTDDKSTGQDVRAELKLRLDEWLKEASNKSGGRILGYMPKNDGKTVGLLHKAGSGEWQLWTCLNALRDVEPSVNLVLERISD